MPTLSIPRPNLNAPVPNLYGNNIQNLLNTLGAGQPQAYQAPNPQHQQQLFNLLMQGGKVDPRTGIGLSSFQAAGRGQVSPQNYLAHHGITDPVAAQAAIDQFKGMLSSGAIVPGVGSSYRLAPASGGGGGGSATAQAPAPPPAVGAGGGEVHAIQGAPLGDLTSRLGNQINPVTGQPYNAQLATGGSGGIGPGNPQYQAIIDQQRGWGPSITDALRPGAPAHAGVPGLPAIGSTTPFTRAGAALPSWMHPGGSPPLIPTLPGAPPVRPAVPPPSSIAMPPRRLTSGLT